MDSSDIITTNQAQNEDLTPLEQDVLDEYERLAENMKKVDSLLPLPVHIHCIYKTNKTISNS
jgi:hypothetical protein